MPKKRANRNPTPYMPGVMEDAGIEIIQRLPDRDGPYYGKRWNYEIKYLCCGAPGTLTHERIMKRRAAGGPHKCQACACKVRRKKTKKGRESRIEERTRLENVPDYDLLKAWKPTAKGAA